MNWNGMVPWSCGAWPFWLVTSKIQFSVDVSCEQSNQKSDFSFLRVLEAQRGKSIQNFKIKQPIKKIKIILCNRNILVFLISLNHPVSHQIYSLTKHMWNSTYKRRYKHWYNTLQHCIVGFLAKSSQFFKPLWKCLRAPYGIYTVAYISICLSVYIYIYTHTYIVYTPYTFYTTWHLKLL